MMSENNLEIQVESIRSQSEEKQPTDLDRLKALDAKVKRPAAAFGYTYGSVSALIMGTGMSLIMTELGSNCKTLRNAGVALGVIGIGMALSTAPIYRRILNNRKKKYASEIFNLSQKILNQ